ncbi:hypothetical protein P7K49_007932, partial [Saguinus oedipus]
MTLTSGNHCERPRGGACPEEEELSAVADLSSTEGPPQSSIFIHFQAMLVHYNQKATCSERHDLMCRNVN